MSSLLTSQSLATQPLSRAGCLQLLKTALSIGENRYARRLALAWLANFPGDLEISLLHAQASYQEGQVQQILPSLEHICEVDPEYLDAQKFLSDARHVLKQDEELTKNCVVALGGRPMAKSFLPKWAIALREAQQALAKTQSEVKDFPEGTSKETWLRKAEGLIHQALVENPSTPLAAIAHLKLTAAIPEMDALAVRDLAQVYYARWPKCLVFALILADSLMDSGKADQAVALLHQAVAEDILGQVARRLWGEGHRYASLWPMELSIGMEAVQRPQEIPIPAAVASVLGWNMLPAPTREASPNIAQTEPGEVNEGSNAGVYETPQAPGFAVQPNLPTVTLDDFYTVEEAQPAEKSKYTPLPKYKIPETLVSVQHELEQIAEHLKQPSLGHADGRFPVYVIFSTRAGLEKKYGPDQTALIDTAMHKLAEVVARQKRWGAIIYYADRPEIAPGEVSYQLRPASPADPWELKLALADLDAVLGKRGEMIGAVLIVGGPEVVPFHRLPNPVDDSDIEIPSDNPYTTRDENYFIPEWPIGRLPGGAGNEPKLLLDALANATQYHLNATRPSSGQAWWKKIGQFFTSLWPWRHKELPSLGYSAAIWRRASLAVFRPIGEPRYLLVSPPLQVSTNGNPSGNGKNTAVQLPIARLGYYNLHGLPDSAEWYGQRDTNEQGNEIDFPLALRPEDLPAKNGSQGKKIPQVVFSEACYGANIQAKTCDQAMSLKFLQAGSLAFVGSTVTSYGSIASPLIAADLLGRAFWQLLREGLPAGEALRRAKIVLAKEMHRRQGYLDGEDQKTLISFVLYGDPLAQISPRGHSSKAMLRSLNSPTRVRMVCDKGNASQEVANIPPEVMRQVKHVVAQYLPGMVDAQLSFHTERAGCSGDHHSCPTAQFGAKSLPTHPPHRKVVVLSKQIQQSSRTHRQYARLTLDEHGKLVKLVVSR